MSATEQDRMLHAMDLAVMREWDEAKAILESIDGPVSGRMFLLVCEMEQHEQVRNRSFALVRHEIGNALTIAQANVEGIMDGVLLSSTERLEGVLASLASASRLLDDLKKPHEPRGHEVIRIEAFNVCALIGAHASAIAGLAQAKNVSIIYDPCGKNFSSCTNYRGDPTRVGQVLRNVLINAVRYTPPGGSVEIRCDKPESELTLVVRDTGIGILPEDATHVFEPGYRGGNATPEGSGLGLAVVHKLLKSLGGNARVVSHDGGGATFELTLPAVPLTPLQGTMAK
ncbi:MAG: HAMP domain-containing sensor histidine kinase [Candidatus Baltobacteraceae bacterium]